MFGRLVLSFFLLNPVKSVEEMPVRAATPPIGTLTKAPIPVTAVAIPAEENEAVKVPKPIAEAWAMPNAFLYFLPLGCSDQPCAPIRKASGDVGDVGNDR